MTNNEAREYFKQCDLSYKDLTSTVINKLRGFISKELRKGTELKMTLSRKNREHFYLKEGIFHYSAIKVDGVYFQKREAVSFNPDGFIGFAGWASSNNVKPIINGFINWCKWLKENKNGANNT